MADDATGRSRFWTQANALLRKNLTFQKRNVKSNIRLVSFPFILCLFLVIIQYLINTELDKPANKCGCTCIDTNGDGKCERVCDIEYSDLNQVGFCAIRHPTEWPPLVQIPAPNYRAVSTNNYASNDFPNELCRRTGNCPATLLFTGSNQTLGENLMENMLMNTFANFSNADGLASSVLGTDSKPETTNFFESAFFNSRPIYNILSQCPPNSSITIPVQFASSIIRKEIRCVPGLRLWRNASSDINDVLFKGYFNGNSERKINEILAAYDFSNSNEKIFNATVWFNSTFKNDLGQPSNLVRVPRSLNLASRAYLQYLMGQGTQMLLEFVKEMPKPETALRLDISSILGSLFFTWVILQLFPVVLGSLVYEKEQKLRIMMKMHGLGDGPYWMISYAYFLFISVVYMLCFVIFGSVVGLKFFTLNDYSIQFVFFFIYINLQISVAFLVAAMFSNVKTATVVAYIGVFGTGLLGAFLFQFFVQDSSFPNVWIIVMELYPGFALYRGLYEFSQYSFDGNFMGTGGMVWANLSDSENGMKEVLIIMLVEWVVVLFVAYFVDRRVSSGRGIGNPIRPLLNLHKKTISSFRKPSLTKKGSRISVDLDKADVQQEREKVEQLLHELDSSHAIIADDMKKIYPGRDGNPPKVAVRGLSIALPRGECFGMLGPNGAGKTSFISMMIGLTKPTSGTAYVQNRDIRSNMDQIYTSMGVCPQHDLLWETLTGREHLFFYGRLKNLKGAALEQAVEESLKGVNLFHGGVGDKQAGKYSGGMKRRLSVAISLIGDPKVVYMDEPSTGLDPASRSSLWNVVKRAKEGRAIILTTHSMEEAEVLCDRLGIFVDGSLQCIGNPKELKARYGGSYVFTMTTSSNHDTEVEHLVRSLSPNANKIYHISGTQKFEIPKQEVRISEVFRAVENAKRSFTVQAWGVADTTLEDVFIKVARGAQSFNILT